MDWIQQAVREFGDTLGIEDLRFNAGEGIEITLDSGELVGIAHSPALASDHMLVYVVAPLAFDPMPQMEAALRLSNARHAGAPYPRAAILDNRLVLSARLDAREFNLPALDEAVWRLVDLQHEAAS
jgi:type III secretion system chaperone SycN